MIITLDNLYPCPQGSADFRRDFGGRTELTFKLWKWAERKDYLYWGVLKFVDRDTAEACLLYLRDQGLVSLDGGYFGMYPIDYLADVAANGLSDKQISMLIEIINE